MDRGIIFKPKIETDNYFKLVSDYIASRNLRPGKDYGKPSKNNFECVSLPDLGEEKVRLADIYVTPEGIVVAHSFYNKAVHERDGVASDFLDFLIEQNIQLQ